MDNGGVNVGESEKTVRSRTPVEVTDSTIAELLSAAEGLVVIDFWADWCQPCTIMSAHLGFLLDDLGDSITVAAMDVEENAQTPSDYGVQGLPTLIFFRGGEEIGRQVGITEYEALKANVEALLPAP